jgi:quercetin dioxygenase-like cupin family protein
MAEDPVAVAGHVYKTLLENDQVRVLEVTIKPGEKTEMHSHPDMVAYILNDGRWKFTHPDGTSVELEGTPGQVIWLEAVEHLTENAGDAEARALLVELK